MRPLRQPNLLRKQYLVTEENVKKLELIAQNQGTSATDIVRKAIEAYDPNSLDCMGEHDLMELLSSKLQETILDTQKTHQRLNKTLSRLESKGDG